jgi:hypothetical protein
MRTEAREDVTGTLEGSGRPGTVQFIFLSKSNQSAMIAHVKRRRMTRHYHSNSGVYGRIVGK